MSAFGQRRKARVINVSADDADDDDDNSSVGASSPEPTIKFSSKSSRKPFRQSGLRKTINLQAHSNDQATTPLTGSSDDSRSRKARNGVAVTVDDDEEEEEEEEDTGPVVMRPGMSRAGSSRRNLKKKPSGLSYNGAGADEGSSGVPKKVPFGQRVLASNALKKSMAMRSLPTHDHHPPEDDSSRLRYSKEYLDELQSSTPNTPQNISDLRLDESDGLVFDSSELDGALIMNEAELGLAGKSKEASPIPATTAILTDAEVRERKERRARMALEGDEDDYISFEDSDGDWRASRKKKDKETRLVPDDEDLGEGFDEFVDDGGIALGKTASREAKKRQRREIADMIQQAEGNSGESSDDSEAERRAAYEAAQARAGMDGLKREKKHAAASTSKSKPSTSAAAAQVPVKITPLPDLSVCLGRLRQRVERMGKELQAREARIAELERDKDTIAARQEDVQRQLEEAGKRYSAAAATIGGGVENAQSRLDVMDIDSVAGKPNTQFAGHRGLESLGSVDQADNHDDDEVDMYGQG